MHTYKDIYKDRQTGRVYMTLGNLAYGSSIFTLTHLPSIWVITKMVCMVCKS